jgi:hypothetical protein
MMVMTSNAYPAKTNIKIIGRLFRQTLKYMPVGQASVSRTFEKTPVLLALWLGCVRGATTFPAFFIRVELEFTLQD